MDVPDIVDIVSGPTQKVTVMKSLSQSLRLFVRCSAVFLMMVAMLFASSSQVYGQGWVPGGERSFNINGGPIWTDISANSIFRFWDANRYVRTVVSGTTSQLSQTQSKFEVSLHDGYRFYIDPVDPLNGSGLVDPFGTYVWKVPEPVQYAVDGRDGYLYTYSSGSQTIRAIRMSDGIVKSSSILGSKWIQANPAGGLLICTFDDKLKLMLFDGSVTDVMDLSQYGPIGSFTSTVDGQFVVSNNSELLLLDSSARVILRRKTPFGYVVTSLRSTNDTVLGTTWQSIYVFDKSLSTKFTVGISTSHIFERPTDIDDVGL